MAVNVLKDYAHLIHALLDGKTIQREVRVGPAKIDGVKWVDTDIPSTMHHFALGAYPPEAYRVKPEFIKIGKFEAPSPMRVEPNIGETYWVPRFSTALAAAAGGARTWCGDIFDRTVFQNNMAFYTEDDACLAARAIIAIFGKSEQDSMM